MLSVNFKYFIKYKYLLTYKLSQYQYQYKYYLVPVPGPQPINTRYISAESIDTNEKSCSRSMQCNTIYSISLYLNNHTNVKRHLDIKSYLQIEFRIKIEIDHQNEDKSVCK